MAQLFASDLHIPLFDFLSADKTLIKNTLKLIASSKLESLKNLVNNQSNDYILSITYLQHLDSNIQSKYKNGSWTEINAIWEQLKENWVEDILDYFKDLFKAELMVPNIKSNELSRATSVFEYMNKGGTPLDTFDIMVAKYAQVGETQTLYDKLDDILTQNIIIPKAMSEKDEEITYSCDRLGIYTNEVLSKTIKELFLNFLSLSTQADITKIDLAYIKKEHILSLKKQEIEVSINTAGKALSRGLAFLQFRCGIHNINNLSYTLMLIPIGLLLSDDNIWNDQFKINKLEFWYWTALFSGRFREKQNLRAVKEPIELYNWLIKGEISHDILSRKEAVFSESNYSDENTLLLENEDKTVPSAIYNGLLQYVLSNCPNDFVNEISKLIPWEISKNGINVQDHHIIPLGSVTTLGESSKFLRSNKQNILNSPLNRTYISQKANQEISSMSIDRYIPLLNKAINYSHCLPIDNIKSIKTDESFYRDFIRNRFIQIKTTLLQELSKLEG